MTGERGGRGLRKESDAPGTGLAGRWVDMAQVFRAAGEASLEGL